MRPIAGTEREFRILSSAIRRMISPAGESICLLKIDSTDPDAIRRLTEAGEMVYEKSAIRRFRQAGIKTSAELPTLPDELAAVCKEFRAWPGKRGEAAKK
jgi:hypothetical protein